MRKLLLIVGSLLLLTGLIFFHQIRLGVISVLLLRDLLDEEGIETPDRGALAWITRSPFVKPLWIPIAGRTIPADLYYSGNAEKNAAILLTHGIIDTGKDDPRLIRFAYSLARAGFVVLIPELRGMKSLRILLSDVDDIVASFRFLRSLEAEVDAEKMGLMGFSYGAGPTFMAASHPSIRHHVKFVVSFGGYYDPANVIRFITTGFYEHRGDEGFHQPEPYGKWVFFINNLDYVESKEDRKVLAEIFKNEQMGRTGEVPERLEALSPEGRALYDLLVNKDPSRVDEIFQKTDARFQDYVRRLSLKPVIPSVDAYLLIGHGTNDPLIPYTESLRIADAIQDKSRMHLAILRLFTHVDPAHRDYSAREFLTVYLPSVFQFGYLIYDLVSQQL